MTYNSEKVSLLGVQSILIPLLIHHSHVTIIIPQVAMSVSTSVAADWLAASDISQLFKNGTLKIVQILDFTFYTVVCGVILCAPSQLHN